MLQTICLLDRWEVQRVIWFRVMKILCAHIGTFIPWEYNFEFAFQSHYFSLWRSLYVIIRDLFIIIKRRTRTISKMKYTTECLRLDKKHNFLESIRICLSHPIFFNFSSLNLFRSRMYQFYVFSRRRKYITDKQWSDTKTRNC